MRKLLLITGLFLAACTASAQQTLRFAEAQSKGLRISRLDSLYQSGIHTDTSLAVFKTNTEAYIDAYQQMLQALGTYLKEHQFEWTRPVKGFNRIYFARNGKVDYFVYQFRPGQLSEEQEQEFDRLLGSFLLNYRFPMEAPVPFAQCSPVTYMPAEK